MNRSPSIFDKLMFQVLLAAYRCSTSITHRPLVVFSTRPSTESYMKSSRPVDFRPKKLRVTELCCCSFAYRNKHHPAAVRENDPCPAGMQVDAFYGLVTRCNPMLLRPAEWTLRWMQWSGVLVPFFRSMSNVLVGDDFTQHCVTSGWNFRVFHRSGKLRRLEGFERTSNSLKLVSIIWGDWCVLLLLF